MTSSPPSDTPSDAGDTAFIRTLQQRLATLGRSLSDAQLEIDGLAAALEAERLEHALEVERLKREATANSVKWANAIRQAEVAEAQLLELVTARPVAWWVCRACGADRTKTACPRGQYASMNGSCPLTGIGWNLPIEKSEVKS